MSLNLRLGHPSMPPSLKTLGVGLYRSFDRPWLVTVYGYLRALAEHTVVLAIFIAALAVSTGLFEVICCAMYPTCKFHASRSKTQACDCD